MSKWTILADELNNDPLSRGYSGMTDAQAANDVNTEYRQVNYPVPAAELELAIRESLKWATYREKQASKDDTTGVFDFPSMSEFMDLFFTTTSGQGQSIDVQSDYMDGLIDRMVAEGSMGANAAAQLRVFGTQTVSRGTELEIGIVNEGDVATARSL